MSGWDSGAIQSAPLGLAAVVRGGDEGQQQQQPATYVDALNQFRQFLRTHQSEDQATFPYRDELKANYNEGQYYLSVNLNDLHSFSEELHTRLIDRPSEYLPIFESAAKEVAQQVVGEDPNQVSGHEIQVQLRNYPRITPVRQLAADHVGTLVTIRGIVVSASRPRIKATNLTLMCRNCKSTRTLACGTGFGGARMPRTCEANLASSGVNAGAGAEIAKCPLDPFMILADHSSYVDQQRLKLQELPEHVPTGELPRHLSLALERYLVGSVKPGTRVAVVGVYTTYEAIGSSGAAGGADKEGKAAGGSEAGIRIPYLRVVGIEQENEASDVMLGRYNTEDEEELRELSQEANLYDKITGSICPAIFDSEDTRNIKQSIACQLFGGSRKQLPDGMRLRGDINVLLLGDPSVAKSQFLKFASQVAPIGVYTSGKGSSAAGLTASVIRDPSSGEFHLEGGALVLADGGLVCIDEFDKMRDQDRVAIHEAMEQQTISIAKAGITTILNSRTSVLAAANPIFGRYDDLRSPTENIDFQTTILSRFDLIFIVRDVQDRKRDMDLAGHVIRMHRDKDVAVKLIQDESGMVDIRQLRRYVAFARRTCHPRLSEEAAELLKNQYVKFRATITKNTGAAAATSIPITVRQLEAIVRIAEARARMELKDEATTDHVSEAIRLFQVSTYRAATTGVSEGGIVGTAKWDEMLKRAERELLNRLGMGMSISTAHLVNFLSDRGIEKLVARKTLDTMVQRGMFKYKKQQKLVERILP